MTKAQNCALLLLIASYPTVDEMGSLGVFSAIIDDFLSRLHGPVPKKGAQSVMGRMVLSSVRENFVRSWGMPRPEISGRGPWYPGYS